MTQENQSIKSNKQGLSITSLVLGILSILSCLFIMVSIPVGVLAVILGIIGLVGKRGTKKAVAGIATGVIGIVLSLLTFFIILAAIPSLQSSQRDVARKSDITGVITKIALYQTENSGTLPTASDIDLSNSSIVKSIVETGEPTNEKAVYLRGQNCNGEKSTRTYSISILLENSSKYCLDM
jgi:hypothetical protein